MDVYPRINFTYPSRFDNVVFPNNVGLPRLSYLYDCTFHCIKMHTLADVANALFSLSGFGGFLFPFLATRLGNYFQPAKHLWTGGTYFSSNSPTALYP